MTTYAQIAARNAETIADVREYEMEESVTVSAYEYQALKVAALVFQIEHGGCQMEIREDMA